MSKVYDVVTDTFRERTEADMDYKVTIWLTSDKTQREIGDRYMKIPNIAACRVEYVDHVEQHGPQAAD